jgi:multidrug efflux pump subunit AcrA (membrane-fusion protein)
MLRIFVSLVLVVALLSGAAAMAWFFVRSRPAPASFTPRRLAPQVQAPPLEARKDHAVELVGYGTARAKVQMEITPLVGGQIVFKAENFLTGKPVEADQVLLRLDEADFRNALEQAQAALELHTAQLQRIEAEAGNLRRAHATETERLELARELLEKTLSLQTRGAATENDVDTARDAVLARRRGLQGIEDQQALIAPRRSELEAQIRVDRSQIRQAKLNLQRTVVRCPVNGRVLEVTGDVGERVQAGQSCGEVYGTEIIEVPVSLAAEDLQWLDSEALRRCRLREGAPENGEIRAQVTWSNTDNGRNWQWPACVGRIEAGLEARTRTATVVLYVQNPPADSNQPQLDLNMFCKAVIYGRTLDEAFLLPRSALQEGNRVYLAEPDPDKPGHFRLAERQVRIERFSGSTALVLPGSGLATGERVILSYLPKPVLGMPVRPRDTLSSDGEAAPASPAATGDVP